jgi:hypoxanthine phosphoribosyltransferase
VKRAASGRRPTRRRPRAEQPLGVGVADAYAVERLNVNAQRARDERAVREIGWAQFGDLARALAERIAASFRPDVILGVVNGGVFLGGALAPALRAEFQPIRVKKTSSRHATAEPVGSALRGKDVLVVDDVIVSGVTMAAACGAASRAGAREVRSATLVARPGRKHPDFHALETDELVVFGWDYGLHQGGAGGGDPGEEGV